jgi:hypothetical protein
MVITGLVYSLLLSQVDVQTPLPWVNAVLHYIFPLVLLIDWLIDPPKRRLTNKDGLMWLSFPLIYAVYTLIRGHSTHWYPYSFINVNQHGYTTVALNILIIALFMIGLAAGVAKLPALSPGKPTSKKH